MAQDWRTVRVFISSTFRDMQAERDHLVRFVFPKLREELLKRRIHLVDVDLRWGVTSDQDAVGVCKKIIDECRPRFVCILGGRYGSVPKDKDRSITADEVHYAVLDRPDAEEYRYFYFRDPATTALMEESEPGEFREPAGSKAERMLVKLKQAVIDAGHKPRAYKGTWDKKLRRLVDLQQFGEVVYQDLLKSIDDESSMQKEEQAPPDEFTEASAAMDAFIQERTERYLLGSRASLLKNMVEFAEGSGAPSVLAVTGEPGFGKSALLAKFCQEYADRHPGDILIPHFIGAGPGTTDLRRILRRLYHELARVAKDDSEVPQDVKELIQQFPDFLKKAADKRRVVLVIDALDQLDAADNAHSLHWLPRELPDSVRVIASSLPHAALEALELRKEQMAFRELRPLAPDDGRGIITEFLGHYQKRMTDEQITALLANQDSRTPLYLRAALEELRTLGTYEEITHRIEELPGETKPLFHWMLTERLAHDPEFRDADGKLVGGETVRKFVSYIGVSRYGMSHAELVELIGPGDQFGNVAALERLLRPYLMYRGDLLNFYHRQFREAVLEEYLNEEQERLAAHRALAHFFKSKADPRDNSTWTGNCVRGLSELPYHQTEARMWAELTSVLTNFDFVEAKSTKGMVYSLASDYAAVRSARANSELGDGWMARVLEWHSSVLSCAHVLARGEEPFLQVIYGHARGSSVRIAAGVFRGHNTKWS